MSEWRLTTPATGNQLLSYQLEGAVSIGRDPSNQIRLTGTGVSRFHAVLEPSGNGYVIRDLNSTNGTYVNRARIKRSTSLQVGDVVRVGNYQLTVARQAAGQSPAETAVQAIGSAVYTPADQPADHPKKRSFWRTCLIIGLVALCGLVALGAGGYYAYTTGAISRRSVMNAVGLGYGEVHLTNISDGPLSIYLTRLDTASGSPEQFNSLRVEPLDIGGLGGIPPGRYLLEIQETYAASCTLQIESGDQFNLVAVPEGIAIAREGYQPTSAEELDLASSSLCRQ